MPEGPEVRRYAAQLAEALVGRDITSISSRLRVARFWLQTHEAQIIGKKITRIESRGKHLIGWIESDVYFHSHLMMWGSWQIVDNPAAVPIDRRERARIVTGEIAAILSSAPIFQIGHGEPFQQVEYLNSLGPDILPYQGSFDAREFRARLLAKDNRATTIGAALLNQQIVAGIGNYLRAEILFHCRIDPWRTVAELSTEDLNALSTAIPKFAARAYQTGATVGDELRARMRADESLVYQPGRDYGTRHFVFRRTNLPCLDCGDTVRQLRQVTHTDDEGEKSRIIYFCPSCQNTSVALKPVSKRARKPSAQQSSAPAPSVQKPSAKRASSSTSKTTRRSSVSEK